MSTCVRLYWAPALLFLMWVVFNIGVSFRKDSVKGTRTRQKPKHLFSPIATMTLGSKLTYFPPLMVLLQSRVVTSRGNHKKQYQNVPKLTADGRAGVAGCLPYSAFSKGQTKNFTHGSWIIPAPVEVNLPRWCQLLFFMLRSKKHILGYGRFQKMVPDDTTTCPAPKLPLPTPEPLGVCGLEDEHTVTVLDTQLLCGGPHLNKF